MRTINLFYITVLVIGIGLAYITLNEDNGQSLSFYGFAENDETKINYNYPVVVESILVSPGQRVAQGDTLIHLTRRKTKESLDDYTYKVNRIKSDINQSRNKINRDISLLINEKDSRLNEIRVKSDGVRKELAYKKSLLKDLNTIQSEEVNFSPLDDELNALKAEYTRIEQIYDSRIEAKRAELKEIAQPLEREIEQILAEQSFDESQKVIPTAVVAPNDGLIGNISCKVDEHIPSYNTLLTFYEPHSGIIRGYVHEDLTLEVELDDHFEVYSLKNPEIRYRGKVTGLGSRIIEIPARLRKIPDVKSFGREVLVSITKDNSFLQKEKVGLTHIPKLEE